MKNNLRAELEWKIHELKTLEVELETEKVFNFIFNVQRNTSKNIS